MDVINKILVLLLIMVVLLAASNRVDAFQKGNELYQQGAYEEALQHYHQILEAGYESGALYFNMGNSYYKLDQLGKARLYYERAAKFMEGDEALTENISILRLRLVDQIEPPPQFFLSAWWQYVINLVPLNTLVWIEVVLLWLVLTLLSMRIYYRSRGRGKHLSVPYHSALVIFIVVTLICIQKIYNLETERHGVIMKPSVTLFAEPKQGGTEVFVLHEGTKVKIERQNQDWFEIRLEDGKTGWLEGDHFEII